MSVAGTLRSERTVAVPRQGAGMAPGVTDPRPVGSEVSRAGDRVSASILNGSGDAIEATATDQGVAVQVTHNGRVLFEYPAPFKIVCAWCEKIIVDSTPSAPVSHGICPGCVAKMGE